jgi:hypothetical protein
LCRFFAALQGVVLLQHERSHHMTFAESPLQFLAIESTEQQAAEAEHGEIPPSVMPAHAWTISLLVANRKRLAR